MPLGAGVPSRLTFELFNPLQCFNFECRGGPRYSDLSYPFDAWDSSVKSRNQFAQLANGARPIGRLGCALDHVRHRRAA